jgi:hypothetical protein
MNTVSRWPRFASQRPTISSLLPVARVGRHGIDLGHVVEVDAGRVGAIEDRVALLLVGHAAEGHRPHADLGDDQPRISQPAVLQFASGVGLHGSIHEYR